MTNLKELLKLHKETNEKMTELKRWLSQKEVVEYYNWKNENPKDRTAMEKVIAQLKLEDDDWLQKEIEYDNVKTKYNFYNHLLNIVESMLPRDDISLQEIDKFIEEALNAV